MGRRRTDGTGVEPPEGGGEAGADDPARRAADLFARMARFQQHHRQGMELGLADLRILWLLSDGAPRTLREISADLHLEQSTVNRQVNTAAAAGLVERDEQGGGPYRFRPSDEGRRAFEQSVASSQGTYRGALEHLGTADAERFLDLLDAFTGAYGEIVQDNRPFAPDPGRE